MNNSLGHSQIMSLGGLGAGSLPHMLASVAPGWRGPLCSGPRPFTEKPQGVR